MSQIWQLFTAYKNMSQLRKTKRTLWIYYLSVILNCAFSFFHLLLIFWTKIIRSIFHFVIFLLLKNILMCQHYWKWDFHNFLRFIFEELLKGGCTVYNIKLGQNTVFPKKKCYVLSLYIFLKIFKQCQYLKVNIK